MDTQEGKSVLFFVHLVSVESWTDDPNGGVGGEEKREMHNGCLHSFIASVAAVGVLLCLSCVFRVWSGSGFVQSVNINKAGDQW